jgi:hypothetical protein
MDTLADFGTVFYFGVQTFTTACSAHGFLWVMRWPQPGFRRCCSHLYFRPLCVERVTRARKVSY